MADSGDDTRRRDLAAEAAAAAAAESLSRVMQGVVAPKLSPAPPQRLLLSEESSGSVHEQVEKSPEKADKSSSDDLTHIISELSRLGQPGSVPADVQRAQTNDRSPSPPPSPPPCGLGTSGCCLRIGQTVEMVGLLDSSQYNGLRGTILQVGENDALVAIRGPPNASVVTPWRGPLGGRGAPVKHSRTLPWERGGDVNTGSSRAQRPSRAEVAAPPAAPPDATPGKPKPRDVSQWLIEQQQRFPAVHLRPVSRSRTPNRVASPGRIRTSMSPLRVRSASPKRNKAPELPPQRGEQGRSLSPWGRVKRSRARLERERQSRLLHTTPAPTAHTLRPHAAVQQNAPESSMVAPAHWEPEINSHERKILEAARRRLLVSEAARRGTSSDAQTARQLRRQQQRQQEFVEVLRQETATATAASPETDRPTPVDHRPVSVEFQRPVVEVRKPTTTFFLHSSQDKSRVVSPPPPRKDSFPEFTRTFSVKSFSETDPRLRDSIVATMLEAAVAGNTPQPNKRQRASTVSTLTEPAARSARSSRCSTMVCADKPADVGAPLTRQATTRSVAAAMPLPATPGSQPL
eukprot:TRINITY_DN7548_c0_g1_i1.p1 TRINITY_DN7548_c0_g1~~TRINITY_DN7548_c0_g1_i1.p1  ORF type:complete len:597 (+),score=47.70 TRINITY_DN7548_c0_g1_i1:69-1793(+)